MYASSQYVNSREGSFYRCSKIASEAYIEEYKKHFDFFSANVAEEFFDLFEVQKLEVYGNVSEDIREALAEMNAKFFSTVARF